MKEIKDYSLLPHNTFGMDVKASLFVEYESVTELQSILSDKKLMAGNWLHIGGGSNLLFKGDYAGTVLHSAIRGYEVVAENEQEIEVRAGAGEVWDDFVAYTVKNSWYGAENLSLIPGEVGASAVQNIGAYGVEAKDFCISRAGWSSAKFMAVNTCKSSSISGPSAILKPSRWNISMISFFTMLSG